MQPMKLRIVSILIICGAPVWAQGDFDAVARGKEVFEGMGCMVCHVVAKDDDSIRTGPSLYGRFQTEPQEREVSFGEGERKKVKADKAYFLNSVRTSWDELAVADAGPTKGTPYLPIMPLFTPEVISNSDLESLWHYARTLADPGQAGPAKVMLKKQKEVVAKNLLDIPNEIPVTTRTRVLRVPIMGSSGRALHVGQPNGMSYTFDPRNLSVRRVWSGGFLNLKNERSGRGNKPSRVGQGASVFLDKEAVLAPLTSAGEAVDFEFKEPDVEDYAAIEKGLWDKVDFDDRLAALDAEFLGHRVASDTGAPSFAFRVGKNKLVETVTLTDDGSIEIAVKGAVLQTQKFKVRESGLSNVQVNGGELRDGVWTLPAAKASKTYRLKAKLPGGLVARPKVDREENWSPQPLVSAPSKPGNKPLELPAGYSINTWQAPLDLYGRQQLFEPTGIAVAKDGTIVVATRSAGVWRIRDGKWTLFAEGLYEALGVWIEDDKGDQVVVAQKPELTRISDGDGDGRAETFVTVCDDFGFHGNYHEYTHGPVRDKEGNYYFLLNLAHTGNKKASWRAGGPFMGSMGGYRGWACRVTPAGKFEPFANGLRSPAGLGIDEEGRIWYAENQGEYVGCSKVVLLEQGKFYGHPSGLVSLPGMGPDSKELNYDLWTKKTRKGTAWLPHGRLANSPGSPSWDSTGGKFGAYAGQMFIGDQSLSTIMRVTTETVNGVDQGAVMPFSRGTASGVMRLSFLPDGSMLVGQTGRGWRSVGGSQAGLQQIVWDGKTVAAEIAEVVSINKGFELRFTAPVDKAITDEALVKALKIESWFYTNTQKYGSAIHEKRNDVVGAVKVSSDRKSVQFAITDFGKGDGWVDRIYHLSLQGADGMFGEAPAKKNLEAYFTLRAIAK